MTMAFSNRKMSYLSLDLLLGDGWLGAVPLLAEKKHLIGWEPGKEPMNATGRLGLTGALHWSTLQTKTVLPQLQQPTPSVDHHFITSCQAQISHSKELSLLQYDVHIWGLITPPPLLKYSYSFQQILFIKHFLRDNGRFLITNQRLHYLVRVCSL